MPDKEAQGSSALDQLLEGTQSPLVLERRPHFVVNTDAYMLGSDKGMQELTVYLERSRPG